MAGLKSYAPIALQSLFDGDLSSVDSESESSMTPSPSVIPGARKKARTKTRNTAVQTPRPRRQEFVSSYAENDTDGESLAASSPAKATKRKRKGSLIGSPVKKMKLDDPKPSRGRSFSSGQAALSTASRNVASLSASWPNAFTPALDPPTSTTRNRVFIRLGLSGQPVSLDVDGYWWPAKKVGNAIEMEGTLYQLYGDDGHGPSRCMTLLTSLSSSIQSIYYPKPPLPRYSPASFQQGSTIDSSRFRDALNELNQDDDDDDDDNWPQEELLSDLEQGPPSHSSAIDWRPPSPSEYESFVDERVLCKSNKGSSIYWPARITGYVPPTKASQKVRFLVDFFDWKTGDVTRDMFFMQYDDDEKRFATCELDRRKLQEWVEKNSLSPQEGDDGVKIDITNLPEPRLPIPKSSAFINQLPIEEQLTYIIPFMQRILEEKYAPSQERIDAWMMGGSSRTAIINNPVQGGHLAEVESQTFGRLVHSWAFPGFQSLNRDMLDAVDADPVFPVEDFDPPERPKGSRRYEGLPLAQKRHFIFDVLIGEAVIQLLIIRAGKRISLSLLGDAEEAELYKHGLGLSAQESTSIMVKTILEARMYVRKRLGLPSEPLIAAGVALEKEAEMGPRRSQTRVHKQ